MSKLFVFIFSLFLSFMVYAAPSNLRSLAQQEVADLEGELSTLCSMPKKGGKVEFLHFIATKDGKHIQVFFPADMKLPESGSKVKIKKAFMVGNSKEIYATELAMIEAPAFKYDGLGEKKVLVNIINYSDKPTQNTATTASYETLYDKIKTGFWAQSFNNITINHTTQDKMIVPQKSTDTCDGTFIYALIDEAKKQATANGIDVTQYAHIQMILPPTNSCGWCGLGSVGGPYTWINACNSYSTVGHELGHNFGLMHSNSYTGCDANWKNCTNNEYMDGASLQGIAEGEFTAVHKQKLKWLDNDPKNPQSQLVTKSGNYFIEPLETLTTGVKTLKFQRAPGEYYYLEFRQPLNYDKSINTTYHKSLGVHFLADNSTASWRLKTIGVGANFTDPGFPLGPLTISLIDYSANGANIMVQVGSIPPPTATPTVTPTKTPTPTCTPTVNPTITPTVTPTPPPPSGVSFNIVPGQSEYTYDADKVIWSSVSVWIKNNNKPVVGSLTNYAVKNSAKKIVYRVNARLTDRNGFVKFGLPINQSTTPGTYWVYINAIVNEQKVYPNPVTFVVK